jgi:hypothetical protein
MKVQFLCGGSFVPGTLFTSRDFSIKLGQEIKNEKKNF